GGARGVEGSSPLSLRNCQNLIGGNEEDLGRGIDEPPDQPRTGDPIGLGTSASDPLHGPISFSSRGGLSGSGTARNHTQSIRSYAPFSAPATTNGELMAPEASAPPTIGPAGRER